MEISFSSAMRSSCRSFSACSASFRRCISASTDPAISCTSFTKLQKRKRMHSSRMRTGRSLTVCCSLLPGGGVSLPWGGLPAGGRGASPCWGGGFSLPGGMGSPWSLGGGSPCRGGSPCWGGGVVSPWSRGDVSLVPGGFSRDPPCVQNHRHV